MTQLPGEPLINAARASLQDTLQKGSLGILGVMCLTATAGLLYAVVYLGPQVVDSIKSIAPTITQEMARQHDNHTAERKAWSEERKAYMEMLQRGGRVP
jgi:hypothetical protein